MVHCEQEALEAAAVPCLSRLASLRHVGLPKSVVLMQKHNETETLQIIATEPITINYFAAILMGIKRIRSTDFGNLATVVG